jgi:protein-S-isoprenylcysteine O-methyltransferase Ste14
MKLPALGPRGEGWVVAQSVLILAIVGAGIAGPDWPDVASPVRVGAGIAIGIAGSLLLVAAIRALGGSLTALPKPLQSSTLRVTGPYRLARHPIYGGLLLDAVAGSLLSSPIPLIPTALLVVLFELKSRHEESMLVVRYPDYEAYRRRVRYRFIPGVL